MSKKQLSEGFKHVFTGVFIPKNIWLCEELSPIQMLVLMQIASLDNDFGCTVSNSHLAKFFGVHKDTMKYHVLNIEELGFIECSYDTNDHTKRTIRCSRKYKLLTAGLLDEIEEYKDNFETQGKNTPTQGKNTPTQGKNTTTKYNISKTLETSSISSSKVDENLEKEFTPLPEISEKKFATARQQTVQDFEPNPEYLGLIKRKYPELLDEDIELELANFRLSYQQKKIHQNLDQTFLNWIEKAYKRIILNRKAKKELAITEGKEAYYESKKVTSQNLYKPQEKAEKPTYRIDIFQDKIESLEEFEDRCRSREMLGIQLNKHYVYASNADTSLNSLTNLLPSKITQTV